MPGFFEEFVVKPLLAKGLDVGQPLTELFVAKRTSTSYRTERRLEWCSSAMPGFQRT